MSWTASPDQQGPTVEDPKYVPRIGAKTYPVDQDLFEALSIVTRGKEINMKREPNTSSDGRGTKLDRPSGIKFKDSQERNQFVKGMSEKVTITDPFDIAKEYNQQQDKPKYNYSQYQSMPNQEAPDTTIIFRTNNTTGEKDSLITITR
jgi:hypothetical protein